MKLKIGFFAPYKNEEKVQKFQTKAWLSELIVVHRDDNRCWFIEIFPVVLFFCRSPTAAAATSVLVWPKPSITMTFGRYFSCIYLFRFAKFLVLFFPRWSPSRRCILIFWWIIMWTPLFLSAFVVTAFGLGNFANIKHLAHYQCIVLLSFWEGPSPRGSAIIESWWFRSPPEGQMKLTCINATTVTALVQFRHAVKMPPIWASATTLK